MKNADSVKNIQKLKPGGGATSALLPSCPNRMPLPLLFSTATRLQALAFVATAAVTSVSRSAAFIVVPSTQLLEPVASFFRGGAVAPTKASSTTIAPKGATEQGLTMGPPLSAGERVIIVGGGIGELVTGQVRTAFVDVSCAKLKCGGTFSNNSTTQLL